MASLNQIICGHLDETSIIRGIDVEKERKRNNLNVFQDGTSGHVFIRAAPPGLPWKQ